MPIITIPTHGHSALLLRTSRMQCMSTLSNFTLLKLYTCDLPDTLFRSFPNASPNVSLHIRMSIKQNALAFERSLPLFFFCVCGTVFVSGELMFSPSFSLPSLPFVFSSALVDKMVEPDQIDPALPSKAHFPSVIDFRISSPSHLPLGEHNTRSVSTKLSFPCFSFTSMQVD